MDRRRFAVQAAMAEVLGWVTVCVARIQVPQLVEGELTCSRRISAALSCPPVCRWSVMCSQPSRLSGEDTGRAPVVQREIVGVQLHGSGGIRVQRMVAGVAAWIVRAVLLLCWFFQYLVLQLLCREMPWKIRRFAPAVSLTSQTRMGVRRKRVGASVSGSSRVWTMLSGLAISTSFPLAQQFVCRGLGGGWSTVALC